MPSGIYKRTKETIEILRKAKLGNKSRTGQKQSKEEIEKRVSQFRNEDHWDWKGDKAGYRAIHIWVERRLGKPRFCQNCGNKQLKHRQYQWANLDHKYKRNLSDWRRLCVKCHKAFDRRVNQKSY